MRLSVVFGRPRGAGHDRPIDQRIERKLVVGDVEPDRIAGLERGALREEQRQPGEAGLADGVDVGIAGDDVGELGLERRRRHVGARRISARGPAPASARAAAKPITTAAVAREERGMSRWNAAAENEHDQRVEQEQRERSEENRTAQILRLAGAVDLMARVDERR